MLSKNITAACLTIALVLAVMAVFVVSPAPCRAEAMTMSPFKIILNAQGQWDDIQAIIGMNLGACTVVTDFDVQLYFDGKLITDANAVWYCAIDDNLFVYFDRQTIQDSPVVADLAGGVVQAEVKGWFTAENWDGTDSITRSIDAYDDVEILKPGRK